MSNATATLLSFSSKTTASSPVHPAPTLPGASVQFIFQTAASYPSWEIVTILMLISQLDELKS